MVIKNIQAKKNIYKIIIPFYLFIIIILIFIFKIPIIGQILLLLFFVFLVLILFFILLTSILISKRGILYKFLSDKMATSAKSFLGIVSFYENSIKISGLHNFIIPHNSIRSVVINRDRLIRFNYSMYFDLNDVLCYIKFYTFFRKIRFNNIDDSKILQLPGMFPRTVILANSLLPFLGIFNFFGEKTFAKKMLENYLGPLNNEKEKQNILISGTSGGLLFDMRFLSEIKNKTKGKKSLLEVEPDVIYKLPLYLWASFPFVKFFIFDNYIIFDWQGYLLKLNNDKIGKIIIKKTPFGLAITFLHNDQAVMERITLYLKEESAELNKFKSLYKNKIIEAN
jgi:hypothetical protein